MAPLPTPCQRRAKGLLGNAVTSVLVRSNRALKLSPKGSMRHTVKTCKKEHADYSVTPGISAGSISGDAPNPRPQNLSHEFETPSTNSTDQPTDLVVEVLSDTLPAEVHGGAKEEEEAAHEHRLLRHHVPLAAQGRNRQEESQWNQPLRAIQLALDSTHPTPRGTRAHDVREEGGRTHWLLASRLAVDHLRLTRRRTCQFLTRAPPITACCI